MYNIGDTVKSKYDGKIGAIIGIEQSGESIKYAVLIDGKKLSLYTEQIEPFTMHEEQVRYSAQEVNALLTSRLLLNPNIDSLYSLNSAKIDYIPYQFRPVLKIIKSDSPRILIADGVGVGKTIEAGLILKELQARFDIKSILVICPRPLITEKKWKNELKEKFGEQFAHIDGPTLRYCIEECELEEEWPEEYQKCIIPYSLFDEAIVNGTKDNGNTKLKKKSFQDLKPFPKFDLVIVDEAHHIKNSKTYAHQAVKMFCDNAESIVMLTATPIQLGDKDLFTLLNLLRPDRIFDYETFTRISEPNPFINEAAKLIRGCDEHWQKKALLALQEAGRTSYGIAVLSKNSVYQRALSVLRQSIISKEERVKLITDVEGLHTLAHIINRTRRRDIGNFTIRKPETLKVSFTDDQAYLYNQLMKLQANILIQLHGNQCIRFMMTTIMRQAASCIHGLKPFLEDILTRRFDELAFYNADTGEDYTDNAVELLSTPQIFKEVKNLLFFAKDMSNDDEKLNRLLQTIENKQTMPNNKVMVFSSFRHTLRYLYEKLSQKNVRVGIIHGGVKDEERVLLRERFKSGKENADSIDVLLFSEVGCEGLDYQFCDCLVNYDLPWNPQTIEQRIGRIDRNGQKSESVSIVNIITEGTIDCDIYERCLSRIGVFNASIGDSEEILGEVTKQIYDIVQSYILNPEEIKKKNLQIADNAIRKMQEQQRLEDEKYSFFGLDISETVMKEELKNATNIHLSNIAIERLIKTYLNTKLGANQYILGESTVKTLRLNEENRKILLADYRSLERMHNPVYKTWERYLENEGTPYEKITFDGEYAAEHQDTTFIMPTHPLVKQAMTCFADEPVECSLKAKTDILPVGEYPFIVYEWQYKGIRPNSVLKVITSEQVDSKKLLETIYRAEDDIPYSVQSGVEELEELHTRLWKTEKETYLNEAQQDLQAKIESLIWSQQGQLRAAQEQLKKTTNPNIVTMRQQEIAKLETKFKAKQEKLKLEIEQCDIITKKLVVGILRVEK